MLTRLLVLAAVIAAFFVFVPTSSAQGLEEPLPQECTDLVNTGDLLECLDVLGLFDNDDGNDDGNVVECPDGTVARSADSEGDNRGETDGSTPLLGLLEDQGVSTADITAAQQDGGGLSLSETMELTDTTDPEGLLSLLGLLELLFGDDDEEQQDNVVCEERQTGDNTEAGEGDLGFVEGFDPGGDDGDFPRGGIPSGYGPTRADEAGVPLAAPGAALLALVGVLTTGLVVRRRRSGS